MLIGQNKPSSVESTAIIDQAVVHGREHIDIQSGKIQMLQADTTLIRFIEPDTFPFRDLVASASFFLLPFLIILVIGTSNLCRIIHIFGPNLYFHMTVGTVIKKCNVQRLIAGSIFVGNIIPETVFYFFLHKR